MILMAKNGVSGKKVFAVIQYDQDLIFFYNYIYVFMYFKSSVSENQRFGLSRIQIKHELDTF